MCKWHSVRKVLTLIAFVAAVYSRKQNSNEKKAHTHAHAQKINDQHAEWSNKKIVSHKPID